MGKSNVVEMEKEIGSQVQLFIWRKPKKNHDAMVQLQKPFNDLWRKHGGLRTEVFQLTNTETYEGCTNIANTVSAGPDEEIWVELQAFRDRKHMDEVVIELMNDENMRGDSQLLKQYMDLVTPESGLIMGKFSRLRI
jgi:uncharacterized protein YbaA (DUF1428 family)